MIITDPFTGLSLNAVKVRRLADSYAAIKKAARSTPIEYTSKTLRPGAHDLKIVGHYKPETKLPKALTAKHPELAEFAKPEIKVAESPYERVVASHEVGHRNTSRYGELQGEEGERAAWKWALKNRSRLGVSKRKVRRLARAHGIHQSNNPKLYL